MAFVATGQTKYLNDAATKLLASIKVDPLPNTNDIREYFAEFAMLYSWIRPNLTVEQNANFASRFNRWCEISCAINTPKYYGGWNYADSDLTTGQYLGLLLCDQIFGWEWTKRPDVIKAREAIRTYVEKAKGGMWIESSGYNLGTLQFVLLGCYAAGIENFPEVEALLPDLVEWQLLSLTPDYKQAYQWSDEQDPRSLVLNRRMTLFGIMHGLTGDDRLLDALNVMLAGKTFKDYANLSWRAVYLARVPKLKILKVSEGNGHFIYKKDNAMLCVHFPERMYVHHEVMYTNNIQLYINGEWALTNPLGYGLTAVSGDSSNAPLFAGLSSMDDRGPIQWSDTENSCEIVGGTRGRFYDPTFTYRPPPGFVDHARKIKYEFPGKITVTDTFKGDYPTNVENYRTAEQGLIKTSPLWQQVWHCNEAPVKTPTGYTWKTPLGQIVTLTAPKDCTSVVINETEKWGTSYNFLKTELKWQIRFTSNTPNATMVTVYEVNGM